MAPYPTLFIGGNHEASNYLWELYYGGYVCPNIWYMGHSGVVRFGDLRIGGLSGIFKSGDYRCGHHERPPYKGGDVKSAYHVREFDVFKLRHLQEPVDVFLSHDWPRGIAHYGDKHALFRKKQFLKAEIEDNSLGSPPAEELLHRIKPRCGCHPNFPWRAFFFLPLFSARQEKGFSFRAVVFFKTRLQLAHFAREGVKNKIHPSTTTPLPP